MDTNYNNPIVYLDEAGQPETPVVILATKSGTKMGVISNVTNFVYSANMNSPDEISFTVNKIADGERCWLWNSITDFKLVYVPQYEAWFEIFVNINEKDETVRSVTGLHAQEAELSQRVLYETEINTEDDIARDDYEVTVFYDPNDPKKSLLNRMLADKGQDYTIYHVDASIAGIQRTFTFNGKSIKDCFDEVTDEIECLFVYGEHPDKDGIMHRTISAYDLLDYCNECHERGTFTDGKCAYCNSTNITKGYGNDTGIFISHENIASSVTLKSNADKVKNCFRLEAGDDLMTAVVRSINPNGSQYIWRFSDETKADMSESLRTALAEYDEIYQEYESTQEMTGVPASSIAHYNALVDKYKYLNEELEYIPSPILGNTNLTEADYKARYLLNYLKNTMMPGGKDTEDTTAQEQIKELTVANLSPIGLGSDKKIEFTSKDTADNAVILYSKVYVNTARYRVTVENSSFSNSVWQGNIVVTSFTKPEDTATTPLLTLLFDTVDDTYIRQSIDKMIAKNQEENMDLVSLFHLDLAAFTVALRVHCLSNLTIIRDICSACMDVMIEQGSATTASDIYSILYIPYYNKSMAIETELRLREQEISYLLAPTREDEKGLIDYIEDQRNAVIATLDMKTYLGDTLWNELMSFRRDDAYRNQNYISDGLSDSELIENAKLFLKKAQREIIKASTVQNTLSGNLQDFVLMPEFAPLIDEFKIGNKIHIEIDEKVYQLRMISYEIDYDTPNKISISFSDVEIAGDVVSDTRSILEQSKSIATSYNETARQAKKGDTAANYYREMATVGLDLTNTRIVNDANNQNLIYDQNGLLMRRKDDFSDNYSLEQVKIINSGLYYTNDRWATAKAGIGRFQYIDPQTGQTVTGYGVIANTVVGNLILGNEMQIFNENGTVMLNENGSIFTIVDDEDNTGLFKVRKKNEDGSYTDLIYVDGTGNLVIQGTSIRMYDGTDLTSYVEEISQDMITTSDVAVNAQTMANDARTDAIAANTAANKALAQLSSMGNVADAVTDYELLKSLYLDFSSDPSQGLTIGGKTADGSESIFNTTITNTQMSFKQNGETIAYINGLKYHIRRGEIEQSLTVGSFEWRVENIAMNGDTFDLVML